MEKFWFDKGFEDAKNGNDPELPKVENTVSDYVFFTTATKEEMEEDRESYLEGYKLATAQK